eukprot:6587543-Prorocentrum_lima.AAC.1
MGKTRRAWQRSVKKKGITNLRRSFGTWIQTSRVYALGREGSRPKVKGGIVLLGHQHRRRTQP